MPRKSLADQAIRANHSTPAPTVLVPGDHVPAPVVAIFHEIISSVAPGFFTPTDRALLEQLAIALYACRELSAALVADGVIDGDGKPNQVGRHLRQQQQTVMALQTKLRLTTQSRATKRNASAAAAGAAPSIAEIYENARDWK